MQNCCALSFIKTKSNRLPQIVLPMKIIGYIFYTNILINKISNPFSFSWPVDHKHPLMVEPHKVLSPVQIREAHFAFESDKCIKWLAQRFGVMHFIKRQLMGYDGYTWYCTSFCKTLDRLSFYS